MPYNQNYATEIIHKLRQMHPNCVKEFSEKAIVKQILESPDDCTTINELLPLIGENYSPGTFILSERENCPLFLFDEEIKYFDEWLLIKLKTELNSLKNNTEIYRIIKNYNENELLKSACQIVYFHLSPNKRLCDCITNQEYSDVFRKILIFILTGHIHTTFNTCLEFNKIGLSVGLAILQSTSNYSIEKRLYQSIYSGLIGLKIKDKVGFTSSLGENVDITINTKDSLKLICSSITNQLDAMINKKMRINSWGDYYNEVILTKKSTKICWIADDYIPTLFELKFIEQQLTYNSLLSFIFVPRSGYYANDICYCDMQEILAADEFDLLRKYSNERRFFISKNGMDLGAFNGFRIKKGLKKEIDSSDILVISGARSFEMAQGLNKNVYFTGIAVCRRYTEAVTGIDINSGEGIFLHALPGVPCFLNFRNRSPKYPFAEITALQYYQSTQNCNKQVP